MIIGAAGVGLKPPGALRWEVDLQLPVRVSRAAADFHDLAATSLARTLSPVPLSRKLEQLVEDLAVLDDPQERLSLIVDRSKRVPPLPPHERIDANRVRGCVSVVWLVSESREGRCVFRADAESPIVRGLVLLLCEFYSGFAPGQIAATDVDPLESLGVTRNLSPTRRNGLAAARTAIRAFAQQSAAESGPLPPDTSG